MIKIEFSFGLQLDAAGLPLKIDEIHTGLAQIRQMAVSLFDGCTLVNTLGEWRDPATGAVCSEHGMTLFVLTDRPDFEAGVQALASTIKTALRQAAVYVTRHDVQAQLY